MHGPDRELHDMINSKLVYPLLGALGKARREVTEEGVDTNVNSIRMKTMTAIQKALQSCTHFWPVWTSKSLNSPTEDAALYRTLSSVRQHHNLDACSSAKFLTDLIQNLSAEESVKDPK